MQMPHARERQGRKTSREKPRDRCTEEPVTAAAGLLRPWVPGPPVVTASAFLVRAGQLPGQGLVRSLLWLCCH